MANKEFKVPIWCYTKCTTVEECESEMQRGRLLMNKMYNEGYTYLGLIMHEIAKIGEHEVNLLENR